LTGLKFIDDIGKLTLFEMITSNADRGNYMFKSFRSRQVKEGKIIHNGKILFVDDDQAIANVSKRVLESLGYKVTIKLDANEAFQLFCQKPDLFDLVVTDLMMPDMNGLELSKKILDIRLDIPILLTTGYSENILDKGNVPEGIAGILIKPATISELKTAVHFAIGSSL
jgi:CheY-like chemotaxis protein